MIETGPTNQSVHFDNSAIQAAVAAQSARVTPGIDDMTGYLGRQNADTTHREIVGPLRNGSGASGVIMIAGSIVASWGDPDVPEMLFSATKSALSLIAGVAHTRGLLPPLDVPVVECVFLPELQDERERATTWRHLLQQTSGWRGTLWDKPASADAQSFRPGSVNSPVPGVGWAYNDVRVNLLALCLTRLFGAHLGDVLREHVMEPLGASQTSSWHGYANSFVSVAGRTIEVVSGGAHWGGGLFMSAHELARIGQLYLQLGRWHEQVLLSPAWIEETFKPCEQNRDYGLLWWLNDSARVFPHAPRTGRCARGNGGRHLLWIDPARALVIASHWGEGVSELLTQVSASIALPS